MSKYKGLFTFDVDSHRYLPIALADGTIDCMGYHPEPAPLIKDEKIRKVVRAWADANNANVVYICTLAGGWGVRYDWEDDGIYSIDLLFKGNAPLGVGNQYTIDELCGMPEPLEPSFIDLDERIKEKEKE